MVTLVALSLLLLGPADAGLPTPATQPAASEPIPAQTVVPRFRPQPGVLEFDQGLAPDAGIFLSSDVPEHTCLKIRAYVFALNDDRAPKFVRETTCLNVKPRAKKAEGTQPAPPPALHNADLR